MNKPIINLIITGGIGATKSISLYEKLQQDYQVRVYPTQSALKFISNIPNLHDFKIFDDKLYDPHTHGQHLKDADDAVMTVVYPATYNFIGKLANGIADNFPTLLISAFNKPIVLFPSMNFKMYSNEITNINKQKLMQSPNIFWVEPEIGLLASRESGIGRLPEIETAFEYIKSLDNQYTNLKDKKVMINLGKTRSYIDSVRYITNGSSGLMGKSLIDIANLFTNKITAITGDTDYYIHNAKKVVTNEEMLKEMLLTYDKQDIVICSAALYDYEVENKFDTKLHKQDNLNLHLVKSIDVLEQLGKAKTTQTLVGFSLNDTFDFKLAKDKMIRKNLDVLIMNKVDAMDSSKNEIIILNNKNDEIVKVNKASKITIAKEIWMYLNNYQR